MATTALPAVYRPNGYAQTTTAGKLHARANFFYLSTPSMRNGRDGGNGKKRGVKTRRKKEKRLMIIVATTSLPAVDRPNANRWNTASSCQ